MSFYEILRRTTIAKKLRKLKNLNRIKKELLPKDVVKMLEINPDKIPAALELRLQRLPDEGKSLLLKLDEVYKKSALSRIPEPDETKCKDDMLFWHFAYGFSFNEYVSYHFENLDKDERLEFASDRDSVSFCLEMNDIEDISILRDKANTYKYFKPYFKRDAIIITDYSDFDSFLSFLNHHKSFVKKNVYESCGRSVELVNSDDIIENPKEYFERLLSEGKILLEALIIQSNELKAINSSSVNTLRVTTFRTKDGVKPFFLMMKNGRKGMFVDNGGAGGLIVAVDKSTGILGSATDEFGNRFDEHPDSGFKYIGYQLPDFEQALNMCCEMSEKLPSVRIIGWDIAHTENGWVCVEGNSMTEFIGPQSTQLRGIRKEAEQLKNSI